MHGVLAAAMKILLHACHGAPCTHMHAGYIAILHGCTMCVLLATVY